MTSPELKLYEYREKQKVYEDRRKSIYASTRAIIEGATVDIPEAVGNTFIDYIYSDSRSEEYEMVEEMRDWIEEPGPKPLFDKEGKTMALVTQEGYPETVGHCNSMVHIIRAVQKLASNPALIEVADVISFEGFTGIEINGILNGARIRVEDPLHNLRDIRTHMDHYLLGNDSGNFGARAKLNPAIFDGKYPDEIMDERTPIYGPKVATKWWMDQVLGSEKADMVMTELMNIMIQSQPDDGHPPVSRGFGSNTTNRLKIDELAVYRVEQRHSFGDIYV